MPARLRGAPGSQAILEQTVTVQAGDLGKTMALRCDVRVVQSRVANREFLDNINFWNDRSSGSGVIKWDGAIPALRLNVPDDTTANDQAVANHKVKVNVRYRQMRHTLVIDTGTISNGTAKVSIGTTPTGAEILAETTLNQNAPHIFEFVPNVEQFYIVLKIVPAAFPANAYFKKVELVNHETPIIGGFLEIRRTSDNGLLQSRRLFDGTHTLSFVAETSFKIKFITETEMWVESAELLTGPLEIASVYEDSDIPFLQWTQSADVVYFAMQRYTPRKLIRFGDLDWSLAIFDPAHNPFSDSDNFPIAVAFFDQRLWYAGTVNKPQTLWGSRISDFENFILGTADDDAMEVMLSTGRGNQIQTLVPISDRLFVGTAGSEHLLSGSQDKVVGPKNLNLKRPTSFGSQPATSGIQLDTSAAFIERGGLRLRLIVYDFQSDAFVASDLSILADHLIGSTMDENIDRSLAEMAYQASPNPLIWLRRRDGRLLSVTFNKQQEVVAWARHTLGGNNGPEVRPEILSIAVVPHPTKPGFQTWLIVDRLINGSTARYIEFFGEYEGSYYTKVMVDCAITGVLDPATRTISGLGHLEGQEVAVIGDGNTYPNATVVGGQIVISSDLPPVSRVEVGLPFTSILEILPVEVMSDEGTSMLRRSMPRLFIDVRETLGIVVNGQTDIPFRNTSDPMDAPPPLFTGPIEVSNIGTSSGGDFIRIEQSAPKPCEILALIGRVTYGDN